jgi:hypothetical protein
MAFRNGAGLAIGGDRSEARKIVSTGKRDRQSSKPSFSKAQDHCRTRLRYVGLIGCRRRWRHSLPFTCAVWRLERLGAVS